MLDECTIKDSCALKAMQYLCKVSPSRSKAIAISPPWAAIFIDASSGVSTFESNGVSKSVSEFTVDFFFSDGFFSNGVKRSRKVRNSNFSKSGIISSSSGPFQASASTSKVNGASCTSWVSSRFRMTLSMLSRND